MVREGDQVKSLIDGKIYKISRVVGHLSVLDSDDGKSQIITEVADLSVFYKFLVQKEDKVLRKK